jgi:hypothetical protein
LRQDPARQVEQRIEADLKKIKNTAYRPKLGGSTLERFGAIMANLSYWCLRCDYSITPQPAATFAAFTAKVPEKIQLIKARKAVTCAKYLRSDLPVSRGFRSHGHRQAVQGRRCDRVRERRF